MYSCFSSSCLDQLCKKIHVECSISLDYYSNSLSLRSVAIMNHTYKSPRSQIGSVISKRDTRRALRKSCDRCHEQKLRCDGSNASLASCQRCQRAGQTCVYSTRSPRQVVRNSNTTAKKTESTSGVGIVDQSSLEFSEFLSSEQGMDWSFIGSLSTVDPALPPGDLIDIQGPGTPTSFQFPNATGEAGDDELQGPIESLWRISHDLEEMLQCVTTTLLQQNIQCCMLTTRLSFPALTDSFFWYNESLP